jgi:hypothetical protein
MRRRRRIFRSAGLAAMVAAAALAMSGCWGKVYGPSNGERVLVIPGDMSDQIIWQCSPQGYTRWSRGSCALSTVWALCNAFPLENLPRNWCLSFTWPDHIYDIADAIVEVTGPNADCLAVRFDIPQGNPNDWFAMPLGFGCTRGGEQLPGTE